MVRFYIYLSNKSSVSGGKKLTFFTNEWALAWSGVVNGASHQVNPPTGQPRPVDTTPSKQAAKSYEGKYRRQQEPSQSNIVTAMMVFWCSSMFAIMVMIVMTILEWSVETFLVNGDRLFEIQRPEVQIGLRLVGYRKLSGEGHGVKTEETGRW